MLKAIVQGYERLGKFLMRFAMPSRTARNTSIFKLTWWDW